MTYNDGLIAELRAQGIGWSDPDLWPVEKLSASRKMLAAADALDVWYADAHALAIENAILKDRIASLEAAAQSHHFAAGSL